MIMTLLIIVVVANLVIALAAILLSLHSSIVSDRYTKSLKSWSQECVDEANRTMQRNCRIIERDLTDLIKTKFKDYEKNPERSLRENDDACG